MAQLIIYKLTSQNQKLLLNSSIAINILLNTQVKLKWKKLDNQMSLIRVLKSLTRVKHLVQRDIIQGVRKHPFLK